MVQNNFAKKASRQLLGYIHYIITRILYNTEIVVGHQNKAKIVFVVISGKSNLYSCHYIFIRNDIDSTLVHRYISIYYQADPFKS